MSEEGPGGGFWAVLAAYVLTPFAFWAAEIQFALRHVLNSSFVDAYLCIMLAVMCAVPVLCVLAAVKLYRHTHRPGVVGLASLAGTAGVFASWFAGEEIRGHDIVVAMFSLPTLLVLFALSLLFGGIWLARGGRPGAATSGKPEAHTEPRSRGMNGD